MLESATALYINGKFLAQRITGVQRFAHGVVKALDRSLKVKPCACKVEILLPPSATPIDGLEVICQRRVGRDGRSLSLWEQIDLPINSRNGSLVCLSGSAPFFSHKCIPTIHDAAIYLYPNAYSKIFVAWYRVLFALRAKCSPLVLTVSANSALELGLYLPSTAYRVVPNSAEHIVNKPSDSSVLRFLDLKPGRFLLAVGSLNPTKNFSALINAYSKSSLADQFPLVIVGAINRDVFSIESTDIDHPNVLWAGSIPDTQLRALYENAEVFVFPSMYEGFGIPPLEAMMCGCPVVASYASSIPEVCEDAAHYFDPHNPHEIIAAIQYVLQNNSYKRSLIEKGRRRALEFSWENSAKLLRSALVEFNYIDQ
jgi:glycosyltransferase involved in cell wall biosynthesis